MGGVCLKEKKFSESAAEAISKPDTERKYKGRKPLDDSWVAGSRQQLPTLTTIIHPIKENSLQNILCSCREMADPTSVPCKDSLDSQNKSLGCQKENTLLKSSIREVKINSIRNSLKQTVKIR